MERLNKYLAHAGVGSRRHCDDLIAAGRVKIDGRVVTDLGVKIDPDAHKVAVDDHPVRAERPVYWAVNKPVGYLCTNFDPAGRPRAVDLIPHVEQRVYTVGRLDEASEGLLLMTNDGDLAQKLMHPRYGVEKTYLVLVAGQPTKQDLQKLLDGVWLAEGKVRAKRVRRLKPQGDSTWLRVVLAEGKNREIRRMLAKLGHKVMRLRRVSIGPVELDRLPKGKARKLSLQELQGLRKIAETGERKLEQVRQRAARKPEHLQHTPSGGRKPPDVVTSGGLRPPLGADQSRPTSRGPSTGRGAAPPRTRRPGGRPGSHRTG
jgi:23S rRNA pseudouridine2605 synthase